MTFAPKTTIGRYEIISVLGVGGMGEVYLAEDKMLDRQVAIKFLSDEFSQDSDKLNRFIQEAKAASALNHPNILTVYEIGEFESVNFIVTEYIDGKTLSDILDEESLDIHKALEFAIQITSALSAAHEAGIIHRDIKSSNVMIRKDGIAKLLDFGLAKLTFQSKGDELDSEAPTLANVVTVPGMLMGTPTYMSPEQARGQKLDVRTDIFSFGILLFEMLTGKRPFVGESYADIMGAILKDEPPPLGSFIEMVPPHLQQILNKTLRKDRDQRYQTVKDLDIDLRDFRDQLKFEAKLIHTTNSTKRNLIHSTEGVHPTPTVQIKDNNSGWHRWSPASFLLVLLITLITAGGIWWFIKERNNNSKTSASVSLNKTDIVSWNSSPGELFSSGKFSPDSKMISYTSAQSGSKNIWVKQTSTGEAIQITKDSFSNQNPIWSPNGDEIAFFSERGNQNNPNGSLTGIWRIPALGGTPISVAAVEDGSSQLKLWSKSGKIYYESNYNLFSVDVANGKSAQITDFSASERRTQQICISSDEQQIAYVQKEGNKWSVMTSSLEDKTPRQIASSSTEISSMVWHPDNQRVLYSAFVNGTFQIFVANINDKESSPITSSEADSIVLDVSDTGKDILVGSAREDSNLWKVNVESLKEDVVASTIDSELWASVSPDNNKVAFQSVKNLSQGNNLLSSSLISQNLKSDTPPLNITENGFLPIWSPNGQQIAFMRVEGDSTNIWSINNAGGKEEKLTKDGINAIGYSVSPYNRIQTKDFSWSPDSQKISYISEKNGYSNLWVVSNDGSSETQFTNNIDKNLLLYCPMWSADGTKLAFSSKSKNVNADEKTKYGFWIFDTETKEVRKIHELESWVRLIGWSESDRGLILASPSTFSSLPPQVFLVEIDVESGKERSITTLKDTYYYNIHLSPDKKTIAYVSHQENKDNIWIIFSNGSTEKKLTSNNDSNLYFSSLSWSPDGSTIFFGKQTRYSLLSMINNFE